MSDLFPPSIILHFPPEVYLSHGVGDLCPLLVRMLHAKKISALQFLGGGHVRVTVPEPAYRGELLSNDLFFEDGKIPVTPAGVHVTVYVRDLPVELSDEFIKSAFSAYGEVFSVRRAYFKDFPDLRNGHCLMFMSVCNPIPSSLNVLGFVCRTWYPGQPVHCTICKESGHLPRACVGAARSPVTWLGFVGRPGASLVLRPLLLLLFRLCLHRLHLQMCLPMYLHLLLFLHLLL